MSANIDPPVSWEEQQYLNLRHKYETLEAECRWAMERLQSWCVDKDGKQITKHLDYQCARAWLKAHEEG